MTGGMERFARRMWAGQAGAAGRLVRTGLLPLSASWRAASMVRNAVYDRVIDADRTAGTPVGDRGARRTDRAAAVVSVGNLAVGGTGKTPFAAWIAAQLAARGRHPSIVLSPRAVDEERLHRGWAADVPTIVDRDRKRGIRSAELGGADVVILDDGFQHRRAPRDLDLVLLAVEDRFPGPVLPRGPYREGATALRRADAIVITRRNAGMAEAADLRARVERVLGPGGPPVVGCVHLVADRMSPLTVAWTPRTPAAVATAGAGTAGPAEGRHLDAPFVVTAIARADGFLRSVAETSSGRADLLAFADHHPFVERDALRIRRLAGARPIVTTAKDAVKLAPFAELLEPAWVLEQRLVWDWGEDEMRRMVVSST